MSLRRPSVLLVSPYSIYPMIHGGAVRLGNLLKRLSAECDVDLFVFLGGTDDPQQRAALTPYCRRIFFQELPDKPSNAPHLPADAAAFTSPQIAERLRTLILAHGYDLVQLEYTELGGYVDAEATGVDLGIPIILTEHDLSFRSHERRRAVGIRPKTARRAIEVDQASTTLRRQFELAACRHVERVHLMSQTDCDLLAELLPDVAPRMRVVPNGVDVDFYTPPDGNALRERLLFVGSFPHLPNLDAARYFLEEIWLQLKGQIPTLRLTLAGARPPDEILSLDGEHDIDVAGEVESVLPLYREHRLLIVPLRAGSGTRLKILEAMACGLPVVSTTIGAEGLGAVHEEHLLIADDPQSFLIAIIRLVTEDDLHARLAENGRRLVEERFSWDAIAGQLVEDYRAIATSKPAAPASPASSPPPFSSNTPEVSVLIAGEPTEACRALLDLQEFAAGWELVTAEASQPLGMALNHAAGRARGKILVSLAPDAGGDDPHWLTKLIAPFHQEAPPAAVVGTVHEIFLGTSRRHRRKETLLHQRLRERFDGLHLSFDNLAIRCEVWEAFPFGDAPSRVEPWRWLQRVSENRLSVQTILAAWIERCRRPDFATLRREARAEGEALQALGFTSETKDLLDDFRNPSRAVEVANRDELIEFLRYDGKRTARFFPWIWTLSVHLAARRGRED